MKPWIKSSWRHSSAVGRAFRSFCNRAPIISAASADNPFGILQIHNFQNHYQNIRRKLNALTGTCTLQLHRTADRGCRRQMALCPPTKSTWWLRRTTHPLRMRSRFHSKFLAKNNWPFRMWRTVNRPTSLNGSPNRNHQFSRSYCATETRSTTSNPDGRFSVDANSGCRSIFHGERNDTRFRWWCGACIATLWAIEMDTAPVSNTNCGRHKSPSRIAWYCRVRCDCECLSRCERTDSACPRVECFCREICTRICHHFPCSSLRSISRTIPAKALAKTNQTPLNNQSRTNTKLPFPGTVRRRMFASILCGESLPECAPLDRILSIAARRSAPSFFSSFFARMELEFWTFLRIYVEWSANDRKLKFSQIVRF